MWQFPRAEKGETAGGAGKPGYRRLVLLIEEYMERGLLTGGERLPAERKLADLLRINRTTVVRALEDLADRGLVIRRRGSGTYINPEKWGVQSRGVFRWHPPVSLGVRGRKDADLREAEETLHGSGIEGKPVYNLAVDALHHDLLPRLAMPEYSWENIIQAEQDGSNLLLGLAEFRAAVRQHLARTVGLDAPLEQILVTSGTQQALFLVTQCLLRPGDAVGVEMPSYYYSLPVFQASGLRLYALPMDEEGVTVDGLDALYASRKPKMLFLNPIFQNPTGTAMSVSRRREILHYCSTRHIPIFEDDAYSLLAFEPGMDIRPLKSLDQQNQVIYSGSLSTYAGRSVRVGWMVAPKPVIEQLAQVRLFMDSGLSVLPQILGMHYLENSLASHRALLGRHLAARAGCLADFLQTRFRNSLSFSLPKGGLYIYARLSDATPQALQVFLQQVLNVRMLLASGQSFGASAYEFRFNFSGFLEG